MPAVADAKFMGDLLLLHGNMHQRVPFIKEIIITAIDVPPDLILPVLFMLGLITQLRGLIIMYQVIPKTLFTVFSV